MKQVFKVIVLVVVPLVQFVQTWALAADRETLMRALSSCRSEEARAILTDPSFMIDFSEKSSSGTTQNWTPLTLAAATGDIGSVELLLGKGANVEQQIKLENKAVSPLVLAAMYGHKEVVKKILTSPGFGSDGYRREMALAQRLQQSSWLDHLRAAHDSELVAAASTDRLLGGDAPSLGSIQYEALTQFPGDLNAQMQEDSCVLCTGVPGSTGSYELVNGHQRTGDYVTAGCCGARFCSKGCIEDYRQQAGRERPKCPTCRSENPNYEEFKSVIAEYHWQGHKIATPCQVAEATSGNAEAWDSRGVDQPVPSAPFLEEPFASALPGLDGEAPRGRVEQVPASLVQTPPAAVPVIVRVFEDDPQSYTVSVQFRRLGAMYQVSHLIWSGVAPQTMTHKDAVAFCARLGSGARLPTNADFIELSRVVVAERLSWGTPGVRWGYHSDGLIQPMRDVHFWSGSVHPSNPNFAYYNYFMSDRDDELFVANYSVENENKVRCVR